MTLLIIYDTYIWSAEKRILDAELIILQGYETKNTGECCRYAHERENFFQSGKYKSI